METKNFNQLINTNQPVVIDFYTEWCGPCKAMKPVLDNLKAKMGDKVKILKIDIDENQDIAIDLQIRSVPTIMIFQNGERKWKKIGVSSVAELETALSELSFN